MDLVVADQESGTIYKKGNYDDGVMLWDMRNEKPFWEVVERVLAVWKKRHPKEYKSYIIELKDVKETRKVTRVGGKHFAGVTKDKKTGGYLSYTVDMPQWVVFCLRKLYDTSELAMDKEFFNEFGRRFPEFRIRKTV